MTDMKLLHVNLFLKDMSLSLLCEHKKVCFFSGNYFLKCTENVYFYII